VAVKLRESQKKSSWCRVRYLDQGFWPSAVQSFSVPSPAGFMSICYSFTTPEFVLTPCTNHGLTGPCVLL
jgi:hypothetical protein